MDRRFADILEERGREQKFLCVGLDPDYARIPESVRKGGMRETIVAFNRAIVDATRDLVCAYKPNTAFYEAHGDEGFAALRETIMYILDQAPGTAVIVDCKRGDIGATNLAYAQALFDRLRADAITVHPYAGFEALEPLFARPDKGVFVWCRSSNSGAGEFQDLLIEGEPLYARVAARVASSWNSKGNCGLIVGATYPDEIKKVRSLAPDLPFLIPGVGAQGGDMAQSVAAAKDSRGGGFIISASRAILYASSGKEFASAARAKALELDGAIRSAL